MPKTTAVSKKNGKQVIVWFPKDLIETLDQILPSLDTDRSKFLRAAAREKIDRESKPNA